MPATDLFIVLISFIAGVLLLLGIAALRISPILGSRPSPQQRRGRPGERRPVWRLDPLDDGIRRFMATPDGQRLKKRLGFILLSIVIALVLVTLCAGVLLLFHEVVR